VFADEAELVRRCLARESSALQTFVERFQGAIYGLCYRMLGHCHDAEDVTQDVLLRALRSLDRWDPGRPLKPWLFTIAANRCRTALASRARRPVLSELNAEQTLAATAEPAAADLGEELETALTRLREEYRLCFVLFHQQELSCAEIGEILGCPQGTVKTWLHRARRELAAHLRRRGFVNEPDHELHRV